MGFISAIIIGLIVGFVAKLLMPGRDPGGFIITILLGVAGAFVAHLIGRSMGFYAQDEPAGFIASIVGAMLLLGVYRLSLGRRITH